MSDKMLPKWLCKLLSYITVFTCGGYAYAATHGNPPESYRVVLTCVFGLMFFILSLPDKKYTK